MNVLEPLPRTTASKRREKRLDFHEAQASLDVLAGKGHRKKRATSKKMEGFDKFPITLLR